MDVCARLLFRPLAFAVLLSTAPVAEAWASGPGDQSAVFWALAPLRILSSAEIDIEVARLRAALAHEVPLSVALSFAFRRDARDWVRLAQAELALKPEIRLDRPQLIVVIDRAPQVQALALVLVRADKPWEVLGGVHVSTGQEGRFDHYVTPTGVFLHTADILDYRAEGTLNENGIRGLGVKGMRVWDFGWQMATKGWRRDGEQGQIRMEMHATDPTYLASRIGRTASQGCIRLPETMNRFLDWHGVLDVDYEHAANDDIRYRALLLRGRRPTLLAGNALVVVDSSAPGSALGPARAMVSSR